MYNTNNATNTLGIFMHTTFCKNLHLQVFQIKRVEERPIFFQDHPHWEARGCSQIQIERVH
jgi:hypothetical protein